MISPARLRVQNPLHLQHDVGERWAALSYWFHAKQLLENRPVFFELLLNVNPALKSWLLLKLLDRNFCWKACGSSSRIPDQNPRWEYRRAVSRTLNRLSATAATNHNRRPSPIRRTRSDSSSRTSGIPWMSGKHVPGWLECHPPTPPRSR